LEILFNIINSADELLSNDDKLSALSLYKSNLNTVDKNYHFVIYLNMGVIYYNIDDFINSEVFLRHTIFLNNNCLDAYYNLSCLHEKLNDIKSSISILKDSLSFIDNSNDKTIKIKIYTNLGRLLEFTHNFSESEFYLFECLKLDTSLEACWTHWLHLRQRQCKWPIYVNDFITKPETLNFLSPIASIAYTDDLKFLNSSTSNFVNKKIENRNRLVPFSHNYGHEKFKIAFLSSNLNTHAVSLITIELFEKINRDIFCLFAFSWSPTENTYFSQRVEKSFDYFFKVKDLTDSQISELIISHEIDIIIDLQGLTSGARLQLISLGCAPFQISYLGYPGTCPIPNLDYIMVDEYLYNEDFKELYFEKALIIDGVFQPCDNKRVIGNISSKSDYNLPEDKFIFCCFNNIFKITPEIFSAWMKILLQCDNSVLWVLDDNEWSTKNLKDAACFHGVDPNRIYFSKRILPEDYLARFQLADLFLDTFPFNGGVTANDVLWAGLPLLTLSGNSFSSRMAGALLNHLGFLDYITTSFDEYISKAIYFYNNYHIIEYTKDDLKNLRLNASLFNSDSYVRNFENALLKILS